ncbi:MAG: iron-containing alcohol dehydrogenase [Desulfohalobiaceae bacterium]
MLVTKFAIPEIIFGKNSLQYLGACAKRNGANRVLLVSDPGLQAAGWVDRVLEHLDTSGLNWVYFDQVNSNPRDHQVHAGAEFYLQQRADVIVALGGGSPMDLAKGIALIASNGGQVSEYEGANRIQKPLPPMIFIPTTAGSGADISQFAIINDVDRGVKMSIISRTLTPNISIIDPNCLLTKPDWLIVASAVDALCHAVEGYLSRISSPFTEMHSLRAIELIMQNLQPAMEKRSQQHLSNLSTASTVAGMSFSNAGLGMVHSIAHALGGMFDVMHGSVHSILLPAVMRFNQGECTAKMAAVGRIICGRSYASEEDCAKAGVDSLQGFFQELGVPIRLREIIQDRSRLTEVSKLAVQDACGLTNPRHVTEEDCLAVCEEVW